MLAAELHGKISDGNLSERMEDVLTSYVMSLFRYLNNQRVPLSFLSLASGLSKQSLEMAGEISSLELFFWPHFSLNDKSNREPDALLLFKENENLNTAIEIEAKYLYGLSNIINPTCDEELDKTEDPSAFIKYGHQLADEYCGLYCGKWNMDKNSINRLTSSYRKHLVFITMHYDRPRQDLQDAVHEVELRKCYNTKSSCGFNPENNIFWVSWRHLFEILDAERLTGYVGYSQGEINLLEDVRSMLIRKGLVPFYVWRNLQPVMVYNSPWERKVVANRVYWNGLEALPEYISVFS